MTKDNKILGSFSLKNIPPGPAGQEKFDVTFEINSNGVLTATATHRGNRRNTGSIKIDARTSGRLTEEEVNAMIEEAEKMKLQDETEENRVKSLNRLEALCSRIKFKAKEGNSEDVQELLETVRLCLTWMQLDQDASMFCFDAKFEEILKSAKTVFPNDEDFGFYHRKSTHVFEMSTATARNFMDQGEYDLRNNNLKHAFECFQKAYKVASRKGKVDMIVAALQRMGHVKRLQVEQESGHTKKNMENCFGGALMIAIAMETGYRRELLTKAQQEELAGDLQFLSTEFFAGVLGFHADEIQKTSKKFMKAIDISHRIEDTSWNKVIFNCNKSHISLYIAIISEKLERDDFKEALNDINEIAHSKEEASRLAHTKAEKKTLLSLLLELEGYDKLAMGMMLINQAEETMKQGEDNSVERAFVALDLISEAKMLTKQVDMKYFCKAKLYEGKLLLNLFFNKDKAKACLKEVMDISLSERYTDTLWFKEANALFEKIKKEEETPEPTDEKDDCMKELESELKELDCADRLNDEDYINFLFRKFPPKHHSNPKKPDVQSQNFATLKRAYAKLSGYTTQTRWTPVCMERSTGCFVRRLQKG